MAFLKSLCLFNRKERYHLLNNAMQNPFQLSDDYRKELKNKIGVNVPQNAWVAMDYHLDWLSVAVELFRHNRLPKENGELPNSDGTLFRANQQDIDLVIAFERGEITHLILIEAKAYEAKWDKKQLRCKLKRLRQIFNTPCEGICPYLVLTSPCRGKKWVMDRLENEPTLFGDYFAKRTSFIDLELPPRFKITRTKHRSAIVKFVGV